MQVHSLNSYELPSPKSTFGDHGESFGDPSPGGNVVLCGFRTIEQVSICMTKAHFLIGSGYLLCSMSRSRSQDVSSLFEMQPKLSELAELNQPSMFWRYAMHVLEQHSAASKKSIGVLIPYSLICYI